MAPFARLLSIEFDEVAFADALSIEVLGCGDLVGGCALVAPHPHHVHRVGATVAWLESRRTRYLLDGNALNGRARFLADPATTFRLPAVVHYELAVFLGAECHDRYLLLVMSKCPVSISCY